MYLCLSKTEVIKDLAIVKPYIWGDWLRNPAKIKGKNYSAENRSTFRYANTGLIPPGEMKEEKINDGKASPNVSCFPAGHLRSGALELFYFKEELANKK